MNLNGLLDRISIHNQEFLQGYVSSSRISNDFRPYASKVGSVGAWGFLMIAMCATTMLVIRTWYAAVPAFSGPAEAFGWELLMGVSLSLAVGVKYDVRSFYRGFAPIALMIFMAMLAIAFSVSVFAPSLASALQHPLAGEAVPVVSIGWVGAFYFTGGGGAETSFFQSFLFYGFATLFNDKFGLAGVAIASQIVAGIAVVYHFAVQFFFPNLWPITPLASWEFFTEVYLMFNLFNLMFWGFKRYEYVAYAHGVYDLMWTLLRFYAPSQIGFGLVGV